jgi:paraquat-inducible protein B
MVTGQLMINFDLHQDTPVRLVGGQKIDLAKGVTEIPTIQTSVQKLEKTLKDIPIGEIVKSVNSSLKGIESIVTSEELTKSLHYFKQTMKDIRDLVRHVDVKIDPLLGSATAAIGHADELVLNVNKQIDPLAAAVKKTADAVTGAADAARPAEKEVARAFANIAALTGKGSEERRQLDRTLKELQGAARSIKIWAEYLERHPEALIRGKGKSKRR